MNSPATGNDQPGGITSGPFEWTTLKVKLVDQASAIECVDTWASNADDGGTYLGGWVSENGALGRIWVLRRFEGIEKLLSARRRQRCSGHPLSEVKPVRSLVVETFVGFPFTPPVTRGFHGPAYEIRDYRLVPGGLPTTIEGWRNALPARNAIDPITVVMYALDGHERIVHIWPFESPNDRLAKRTSLRNEGVAASGSPGNDRRGVFGNGMAAASITLTVVNENSEH